MCVPFTREALEGGACCTDPGVDCSVHPVGQYTPRVSKCNAVAERVMVMMGAGVT